MIAARQIAFGKAAGKKEETPAYWGLCFTAEEAGSTVAMQAVGSAPAVTLETSFDGEIWEPFTVGGTTITLPNVGDKVYFRAGEGGNTAMASSTADYNKFSIITGRIAASGNIMSLLNGGAPDSILADYCYANMFNGCTSLAQAPELPVTTLADRCYTSMFNGCTSLAQAPELPATTLANRCYANMFNNCTSLAQAPELPATTLADNCYDSMFNGCTSLVNAPELPATTLASYCYSYMFNGCTSLVNAPELPATTLAEYCYASMFNRCISLVQAPELPVTTLANNCYRVMFSYCTSLTQAPELPATTLATFCYYGMFMGCRNIDCIECSFEAFSSATLQWLKGVSSTGTFICPTALGTNETIQRGLSYCPNGWTVINKG